MQAAPQYAADRIVVKYKSAGGRPDIRAVKLKPGQTVSSAVGTYSQLPSESAATHCCSAGGQLDNARARALVGAAVVCSGATTVALAYRRR